MVCCVVQLQAGMPAVDCVLFPMIVIVQKSICVFATVVEVLDVLHHERKLVASLGPQRARFDDQHRKLRLLYRVRTAQKIHLFSLCSLCLRGT
jgi:hypothetical protein